MGQVTASALRDYFDGGPGPAVTPLPDHGCVFVRNAKAGTSSVVLWLHRMVTGDHAHAPEAGDNIHFGNALPTVEDVGEEAVAAMLDGGAYRFAFVRDPLARVESVYRDKIVQARDGRRHRRVSVQRTLGLPEDRGSVPTFEQFVTAIGQQEPVAMDQHWRPQHVNLAHPLVEYDHIGRVETFERDLELIGSAAGLPVVPVERQNASRRGRSFFSGRPDLRSRMEAVYARDFELYGY